MRTGAQVGSNGPFHHRHNKSPLALCWDRDRQCQVRQGASRFQRSLCWAECALPNGYSLPLVNTLSSPDWTRHRIPETLLQLIRDFP